MKTFKTILLSAIFSIFLGHTVAFATGAPEVGQIFGLIMFAGSFVPLGAGAFNLFNPAHLTYTADEIRDFSELIFEKAYKYPQLSLMHQVETGIRAKKNIGISGRMGLIGKARTGCAFTADNQIIPFTEKQWDPKEVDIPFSQCLDDLLPSFWKWGAKMGKDKLDLTQTDFEEWFTILYAEASIEAALRIAWFNATDHANYSDSPAGFITNATDTDYYNIINGLWYQLFDIAATNSDRQYVISENSNATYALQALATDKGQTILANLEEQADDRLRDDEDAVMFVTRSIFDNYMATLRSKGVSESFMYIQTGGQFTKQNGYRVAEYNGIPVIEVPFWDRKIKSDFNNGTKWWLPHRAVYTNPENLALGFEEADSFEDFNAWYNPDEGEWRARGMYSIDAKVVIDSHVQVAF